MTYRQLFDEAIGEPPPSSVDIGSVVAREGRRARVRRSGAAGIAAVAVLASGLGIGALRDDLPRLRSTPATAAASPGPSAGLDADRRRLTDAMLAALDREAPGLAWVAGANHQPDTWKGPTTTEPTLKVNEFRHLSAAGWIGSGTVARDDVRALVSIEVAIPKAGANYARPCADLEPECTTFEGPNGERIRSDTAYGFNTKPSAAPDERRVVQMTVEMVRRDGTLVAVRLLGTGSESPLTTEQMTRIALTPALSLH